MQADQILQLKPTVSIYKVGTKFYLRTSGYCTEIDDETGLVESFCKKLNGRDDLSIILNDLSNKFPDVTLEFIKPVITALDEGRFLQQANDAHFDLDDYDKLRWSRNINFFNSFCQANQNPYEYQSKLKNTKVTLLGLGGLGSHILYDLVCLGVHNITAVDFDKIELSNLNRQILYNESDIGKEKTTMAQARMASFNHRANLKFVTKKLASSKDIEPLIIDSDFVICVADKPRMQIVNWLNEACLKLKKPFINGGLDVQRATFYAVVPGKTGCVECWKRHVNQTDEMSRHIFETDNAKDYSQAIPDPAIVPLVSILTGMMLTEFIKISTQLTPASALGKLLAIEFSTLQVECVETWEKDQSCPVCSIE